MKRKYSIKLVALLCAAAFVIAACEVAGPFTIIKSSNSILINGSIDNLTIPGGIAGGAGAIPPFDVVVTGTTATSVTITNRYVVPPSILVPAPPTVLKVLGTFPVVGGKAAIPAILISTLREVPDLPITSTSNATLNGPGTNVFLIDAVLSSGALERRIVTVTLANTVVVVDNDIYKINLPSTISAGTPSFTITVNSTAALVRVTSRYVVPGLSTAKNYVVGGVNYPTTILDAITNGATVSPLTIAQLRDPLDVPNVPITGLSDVGQQFLLVDAYGAPSARAGTITTTTGSTAVAGVGTAFTTTLAVGASIFNGATLIGTVASITNATNLVLTANASVAVTASAFTGNALLSSKTVNLTW